MNAEGENRKLLGSSQELDTFSSNGSLEESDADRLIDAEIMDFKLPEEIPRQLTLRAVTAGLAIGTLLCFSNMYFGLQTGWVSMGSLQSSILGFAIFKVLPAKTGFTAHENVVLQTTAVATATMPLAGGFVGIIPAMLMLRETDDSLAEIDFSWYSLLLWAIGISFFGVFFAVPLRKQVILREKLRFPSGTATARVIKLLHRIPNADDVSSLGGEEQLSDTLSQQWSIMALTFFVSGAYTLVCYFVPILHNLPLMTWLALPVATEWLWTITPSPSYIGQGMIMGGHTGLSMLLGAVLAWAVLGPVARDAGWAPGPVSSGENGAKGWVLWVALSVLLAESISSLLVLLVRSVYRSRERLNQARTVETDGEEDPAPPSEQVKPLWWSSGLVASTALCASVTSPVFHVPFYEPLVAVLAAMLVSLLAVRALGETDLNPVSGVGKISQLLFGVIAPGNVLSNLVAGGIAEAGALQAGDMMQDLKCGHLLLASPRAQFVAQLIGSFFSALVAVAAFTLYSTVYAIPGPEFPVPTAEIWLDMAKLVNGGSLATNVAPFCVGGAFLGAALPILAAVFPRYERFIPSGIAISVGMYVTPNWTLPRVAGSIIQMVWQHRNKRSYDKFMVVAASGFVLGEGLLSILTAVLRSAAVPPGTCIGCTLVSCSGCP